jgi:very-short-patch-repair endonuclease
MTRAALDHRVATGRLLRLHRRVYRARSAPASLAQSLVAACLACGEGTVASHLSAAMIFELIDPVTAPVHVTVPASRNPRLAEIVVHRAHLSTSDRSRFGVVPVTAIPRTLVDLAANLSERELAEAADRALRRKLVSMSRLEAAVRDSGFDRFRGVGGLRRIVADRSQRGVPGSVLEADMLALLRDFGLPAPMRQFETKATGRTVIFDFAYPDQRVGIELDGRLPHTQFDTWQRDHNRHNAVELGGWRTLRFTWWDVQDAQLYVALTVADALGLRPVRWR